MTANTLNDIFYRLEVKSNTKGIDFNNPYYTNDLKNYVKQFSIEMKFNDPIYGEGTIGILEFTYFDYIEALIDDVDIYDVLNSEGKYCQEIYEEVLNGFNKHYYNYFGDSSRQRILYVTDFICRKDFDSEEFISEVYTNIDKIVYQLIGLNVKTVMVRESSFNSTINKKCGYIKHEGKNANFYIRNIDDTHKEQEEVKIDEDFAKRLRKHLSLEPKILLLEI